MLTSYDFNGRYFRDIFKVFSMHDQELVIMSTSKTNIVMKTQGVEEGDLTTLKSMTGFTRVVKQGVRIKKFGPDIIQTHLFSAGILGILYGRVLRKKVILTRHHIDEHVQVGNYAHRFIDRASAKLADHVVVFSKAAKAWMVDFESVDENKITVINQGFDFSMLEPSPKEVDETRQNLDFQPENFNVVCIARYSKTKGQVYLVEAIEELAKNFENIRLTFVGPGDANWLIDLIDAKGLKKHIKCLPSRSDIAALIAASDLVVHPSLVDSFSQLIIEVQGVGTPLIATDIAAAREQIIDGVTGLIVPPRDSSSIANAVKLLYKDEKLRAKMGNAARDYVRHKFSLDRMYSEQVACYQKVLQPLPEGK
jgi:glycosyltransferase involved in cell wall biosynthesis